MALMSSRYLVSVIFFISILTLSGCVSIAPQPLTIADIKAQTVADQSVARANVEPLLGPLTIEEAVARALKYNLERRTRMLEEAIAFNQLDVGKFDMLPKLVASAGYSHNSEYRIVRAVDSVTGEPSLSNPFISNDRIHTVSELGLSWNMLDFGLSYYNAKQDADRVLIATERRRKAMHNLIQDVRVAFWRTASAQMLRNQVREAILLAEDALQDSKKAEAERLRPPLDALRYQRQVLENLRLLEAIEQELSTAKIDLSHLINIPVSEEFKVVEPRVKLSRAMLDQPVDALEELAVIQNADLREQFYNARISTLETKKALVRIFPNLNFGYSAKHDDDQYLVHQNWNEASAQISYNLLNILSAPARLKLTEAGIALADQRRVATQMAILAQVNVARLQYASAISQFNRADAIWMVDDRINTHVANNAKVQKQSKLDQVASNTSMILSLLRRYQLLAQAQAVAGKLQATLGMEPVIDSVQDQSLATLTQVITTSFAQWDDGMLSNQEQETLTSVSTE
jgi:outer membrane protein TolC